MPPPAPHVPHFSISPGLARFERGLFVTVAVLFLFLVGILSHTIVVDIDFVPWVLLVPAFGAFAFVHAVYMLGWQRAVSLLVITVVISFAAELFGQTTGLLFGPYHYTDLFGMKLAGRIPLIIPFAYFMMIYPCYLMANLLAEGRTVSVVRNPIWIFWLSLVGGMLMTSWDLTMDPLMSCNPALIPNCAAVPAWIWDEPGEWFGVPFKNFGGWLITTTTIFLIYRIVETRLHHAPAGRPSHHFALLPIIAYAMLALTDTYAGGFADVRFLSPFLMGLPAVLACMELLGPKQSAASSVP